MGCQGGRGTLCVLGLLLVGGLASACPASANSITVGDIQVGESGDATFTLTRSAGFLSGSTTVGFQTADGSAGPADYTARTGGVSFGSAIFGATQTQPVAVAITPDAFDEADESFRLLVSGPEVTDGDATATIADDDVPPSLSVADSPVLQEGAAGAKATFVVRLSAPSGREVSVSYATANATATAGQDYTARSGTLVLPAGTTQAPVDVAVLDDSADEPAETFELRLGSPVNASLADGVASATIADNDEPPPPPPPPPPAAGPLPKPPATSGSGSPSSGSGTQLPSTPPTPATSGSATRTSLGLSSPRLKRPATVLVTLSCPQTAGRCRGRVTLFSLPNPRSKVKALRKERRLGRLTFSLAGGRSQTLALALGATDRALLQRTGRMRVRAYATTQDSAGRTGVRSVSGTLIARTAHSSPSRNG